MKYNVECSRCGGTGRHDRGTCFRCHGSRYQLSTRRPTGTPITVTVEHPDGRINHIPMYFKDKDKAIMAVWLDVLDLGGLPGATCNRRKIT